MEYNHSASPPTVLLKSRERIPCVYVSLEHEYGRSKEGVPLFRTGDSHSLLIRIYSYHKEFDDAKVFIQTLVNLSTGQYFPVMVDGPRYSKIKRKNQGLSSTAFIIRFPKCTCSWKAKDTGKPTQFSILMSLTPHKLEPKIIWTEPFLVADREHAPRVSNTDNHTKIIPSFNWESDNSTQPGFHKSTPTYRPQELQERGTSLPPSHDDHTSFVPSINPMKKSDSHPELSSLDGEKDHSIKLHASVDPLYTPVSESHSTQADNQHRTHTMKQSPTTPISRRQFPLESRHAEFSEPRDRSSHRHHESHHDSHGRRNSDAPHYHRRNSPRSSRHHDHHYHESHHHESHHHDSHHYDPHHEPHHRDHSRHHDTHHRDYHHHKEHSHHYPRDHHSTHQCGHHHSHSRELYSGSSPTPAHLHQHHIHSSPLHSSSLDLPPVLQTQQISSHSPHHSPVRSRSPPLQSLNTLHSSQSPHSPHSPHSHSPLSNSPLNSPHTNRSPLSTPKGTLSPRTPSDNSIPMNIQTTTSATDPSRPLLDEKHTSIDQSLNKESIVTSSHPLTSTVD